MTNQELADLKVTPDPELVVDVDLSDRYPLVVCSDCRKLAIAEANASRRERTS